MYCMQGCVEEVKVVYQEVVEVEFDCVEVVYNFGFCYKRFGVLGDVLFIFKKFSNFIFNSIEVLFQVMQCFFIGNNFFYFDRFKVCKFIFKDFMEVFLLGWRC